MKLFAEVNLLLNIYSMQYKYSNLHEIYLVFLLSQSLIDKLWLGKLNHRLITLRKVINLWLNAFA